MNIRKAGYICATIAQFVGAAMIGSSLNAHRKISFVIGVLLMLWGLWRTGFLTGRDVK